MGRLRRKRTHHGKKIVSKAIKTKRYTKDIDQIHDDLKPGKQEALLNQPIDEDLPGLGQFYCVECARHFISEDTLKQHKRSKLHKKRLKVLKEKPYSQQEADAAAGMSAPDNGILNRATSNA